MDRKQYEATSSKNDYKQQCNTSCKEELLAYIKEAEHKQNAKLELYKRNQICTRNRPDPDILAKLDSSLKKNSTFVKKLRNFTASQLDTLLRDIAGLNLSKYLSEVASSLMEAKLKPTDIPAVVTLCTKLNCIYADFAPVFQEQWIKTFCIKKEEPITNPRKLTTDLRFYCELITCGVFSQRETLPLLGTVLTVLTSDKKYLTLSIVVNFCKHCGYEFAGLLPQRIKKLSDLYFIPVPCSTSLSTEKQANLRTLLKDYYMSLCQHLLKEKEHISTFEKQSKQLLNTKGELRQERIIKEEVLHVELQTLMDGAFTLAELLNLPKPNMPESSCCDDESLLDLEEIIGGSVWEDEETRLFYTEFPDLREYLPQGSNNKQCVEEKGSREELLEDEDLNKEEVSNEKNENKGSGNKEEIKKEDTSSTHNDQEGNIPKTALDNFLKHLPGCCSKEMIDNAAIEFLLYFNSKLGRRKLIFTLFTVYRTRLDLLPLYGRLVAILNPAIPEIGFNLCQQLKTEVYRQIQKKDQVYIESKIRSIRFIGELVNLQVFPKHEALQVLKVLLLDFSHHHIEMACNLLETCGRFLYRSVDSHQRTKSFLEQMMRIKSMMVLDMRYVYMIENTYYLVNPPETLVCKSQPKPILHLFIEKVIFQDLMQPGNKQTVLSTLRRLEWDCDNTAAFTIKCLSSPHKVNYQEIHTLAGIISSLVEYEEFIGYQVVDAVLEDIRLGMELNTPSMNQRRLAMIKYLGELYNHRLLDDDAIFNVLYSLTTFGINMDYENPSPLDPLFSVFRIRLVIVLLDVCQPYFAGINNFQKLNYFFTYFQRYYWFKRSSPVWTMELQFPQVIHNMFSDTLLLMCPQIIPAKNYDEAEKAVTTLNDIIMASIMNDDNENEQLDTLVEQYEEEEQPVRPSRNLEVKEAKLFEVSEENHTAYNKMIEDDMEFVTALDQMLVENLRLRDNVKPSNIDISIPIVHKKELADENTKFVLILRKGNKQQCKNLDLPSDSDLVVNLKTREEEERREMEKVKQITLDISQRIQEESITTSMNEIPK